MARPRLCTLRSFAWPVLAIGVFALLQIWRMSQYDAIRLTTRPGGVAAISPLTVSRLDTWFMNSEQVLVQSGQNWLQVMPVARQIMSTRPELIAWSVGYAVVLGIGAWLGAVILAFAATTRWRWLPCSAPSRDRWRAAMHAVDQMWLWGIILGISLAAVVWYTGFDRAGVGRSIIDRMVPAPLAVAMIGIAWSLLIGLGAATFLTRSASTLGVLSSGVPKVCHRCRHLLDGLTSNRCPECGVEFQTQAIEVPTGRSSHLRIARLASMMILAIGTVAAAGGLAMAVSPTARAWLTFRPSTTRWIIASELPTDGTTASVPLVFGETFMSARPAHHSADTWTITWDFISSNVSGLKHDSGVMHLRIPQSTTTTASFVDHDLPFGAVRLCRLPTAPSTIVVQMSPLLTPGILMARE